VQLGQRHRLGHLDPHPARTGRASLGQPGRGALADGQELGLGGAARPRDAAQRTLGRRREVALVHAGAARGGHPMAGDLDRPLPADVDHHDLLAVGAHPHHLPRKGVRHRVGPRLELDHRGGLPDHTGLAERRRERVGGQRVQPGLLLTKRLHRCAAGHPVRPGVDLLAEPLAGTLQRPQAYVLAQQVRPGRHQVRLGDPHRRLRAALGLRVGGHAGGDREAVVAGGGDHVGVADRDPGHVLQRDGLLVVAQPVGRDPAEPAQRGVDAGDHRRQGLVHDREHDPVAAPRKPRAKQPGRPARDQRPGAVVPLQPHPRLWHPRPVHPPAASVERLLDRCHRPAGGPLGALVAQRAQLVVGDVGAQLAVAALHPFLQLRKMRVDQLLPGQRARRKPTGLPGGDIAGDGVMVAAGQLGGVTVASGQVVGFQDLHDLLGRLQRSPPRGLRREHPQ
jgi:hypothetical protein